MLFFVSQRKGVLELPSEDNRATEREKRSALQRVTFTSSDNSNKNSCKRPFLMQIFVTNLPHLFL